MYYQNQNGNILNSNFELVPQAEGNPLYEDYLNYLTGGGVVEQTEFKTHEEILEARPVPEQVPLWALKATLDIENKLGAVESALDQLPEIVKKKAYWIWEYGNFIQRSSQTVGFIGQVLGMNKTEIDTLFINAENIEL
jgi:hypothetical protein